MTASSRWLTLSPGYQHTCGITAVAAIECCGFNSYGQLGTGGTSSSLTPVNEFLHKSWLAVSSGFRHTVAIEQATAGDIMGQSYGCGEEDHGR